MVPEHDSSIYENVAEILRGESLPVQPPVSQETKLIKTCRFSVKRQPALEPQKLLGLFGVLMQFLSYLPRLRPYAATPFEDTEALYQAFMGHNKKPLDFSQQLKIALEQTDGDLPEALWRLFITSRLYVRWFDTSVIIGLPEFSREEITERMIA